jgi:hypothetical protein
VKIERNIDTDVITISSEGDIASAEIMADILLDADPNLVIVIER